MDEENDIDSLEDALKECKDVMGEILPKMFPRAQPSKMKQATQMVEDLKKLVQLEEDLDALDNDSREVMQKYFEIKGTLHKIDALSPPLVLTRRQERLVEKMRETLESCAEGERERQFAELEEKAEHAMKSLDRDQMNRFLGEAAKEFADKTSRILQDVRKTLDMMNLVDEESTKGIACVDRVLMEKAMKDAASIKYKNPNINECQRLCALSEYQFCTLELEAAIKLKDEPRRIHREIRIQELNLDQTGSKYARFEEYRELRSPIEWANARGFFAKMLGTASAKLAMGMMKHSTKPIHLSLTKLEDAESAKKAVFLHKCLLAYGGDGAADAAEPDAAGTSFLSAGLQNKSLRDETYALLIKQLTENPSTMSQRNCEELLGLTLATYPPSAQLEPWVIMFMRAQFGDDPKRLKKFTSILHTSKYGPGVRAIKPIEELRRVFETHTQSRYSLQPLQNSGPTTTQE